MSALEQDILHAVLAEQNAQMGQLETRRILQNRMDTANPYERERLTAASIRAVAETLQRAGIPNLPVPPEHERANIERHAAELRRDGMTALGPIFTPSQVQDIRRFIELRPVYRGAAANIEFSPQPMHRGHVPEPISQVGYPLTDIFAAPHILETISSPYILKIAELALGVPPTIYQSALYWNIAGRMPGAGGVYHRDWDGYQYLCLFVYLTDVGSQHSPHQYLKGTHRVDVCQRAIDNHRRHGGTLTLDDLYVDRKLTLGPGDGPISELFHDVHHQFDGPAGFAFLTNPFGMHRALWPNPAERLMLLARYAIYDNGYSFYSTTEPLPREPYEARIHNTPTYRYMLRPLLRCEHSLPPRQALRDEPVPPSLNSTMLDLYEQYGRKAFIRNALHLVWNSFKNR